MTRNYADIAEAYSAVRAWLSQQQFEAMFTPERLACFLPKRGSYSIAPVLEVLMRLPDASRHLQRIIIEDPAWNDWEWRTGTMARLGSQMAHSPGTVMALRMASEAWVRLMTHAEASELDRAGRATASSPEQREVMLVCGSAIDGRMATCLADIHRDKVERIRAVGTWQVMFGDIGEPCAPQMQLIEYFWRSYHRGYLARRNDEEETT